jgi:hypothetical protein
LSVLVAFLADEHGIAATDQVAREGLADADLLTS